MANESIPVASTAVGYVDDVEGTVVAVRHGEGERVLHTGDLVYSGETVQAKAGGSASLKLEGKTISIAGNSESINAVELNKSSSISDDSENVNGIELSKPLVNDVVAPPSSDAAPIQPEAISTTGHFTTILDQSFINGIIDEDEAGAYANDAYSNFGLSHSAIEVGIAGFDYKVQVSDARVDEAVINLSRPVEEAVNPASAEASAAVEDAVTDEDSDSGDADNQTPANDDNDHGKDDNKDPTDDDNKDNDHGKDDNKDPTDDDNKDNDHGKDDNKDHDDNKDNDHGKGDNKDHDDDKDNGHGKDKNDDTATEDSNDSDDAIRGGEKNDKLRGDDDDNSMYGEEGKDTLRGGDGDDRLFGGEGNDHLRGDKGDDSLYGEQGNDRLHGNAGDDVMFGGLGNDSLRGGAGNDTLIGGLGDDNLRGDKGDDIFKGGAGNDRMSGGKGNDQYVYDGAQDPLLESHDVITDFSMGDSVDLEGLLESLGITDADLVITNNAAGDAQVQIVDGSGATAAFAGNFSITFNGLTDLDLVNTDGVITHK